MTTLEMKTNKVERIQHRIEYMQEAYLRNEISGRVFKDALHYLNKDLVEALIDVKRWMKD